MRIWHWHAAALAVALSLALILDAWLMFALGYFLPALAVLFLDWRIRRWLDEA